MKFKPKSEEEINAEGLWPMGFYPFEILEGSDEVSGSGNDMIKLKVQLFNQDGDNIIVFDYLLEKLAYKLRHCAEVCGLLDKYQSGELHGDDFIGKSGSAKVGIQKDKQGQYPDKNTISDYVVQKSQPHSTPVASAPVSAPALNDEIPF